MVRSLSKLELLKNKIHGDGLTLWETLKQPKYRYIEIEIPYYDYLRGNVLVNDIKEVIEDCPSHLSLVSLINLLYLQFLLQVKKGATAIENRKKGLDLLTISHKLMAMKEELTGQPKMVEKIKKDELVQLTSHTWAFEEREEIVERKPSKKEKHAYVTIRMKTQEIYRGEILINDLCNVNSDFELNVEELIELLYLDFIKSIKNNGNDERVMRNIVQAFEYYC